MGHQMRDFFCSHKVPSHFAQLIVVLLRCNLTHSQVTLGVIDQTEILPSLVNADDSHKTNRVVYIRWDLAINLNKMFHTDLLYFISCEGILKSGP